MSSPYQGQQAYNQGPTGAAPPANHLVMAILTTLFCCLPLGIVSIVYAAQVNSKWMMGDYQGALESSENAKKFWLFSIIGAVVVMIAYFILIMAGIATAPRS